MAIAEEDVRRVKDATDIGALIGERVGLRRVGTRLVGLCPFHAEKTPSFSVNPQLGAYHCFGCGKGGDAIDFLRETQAVSFVEAVEQLASKAGIQLQEEDPRAAQARRRRAGLVEVMEKAVEWYHQRLLSGADSSGARRYLRERGYDGEIVRRYRLGWAPDGWDQLCRALRLSDDVLRDTGLGYRNDRGSQTDAFRARVLFPIFDHRGDPVAIGGRSLPGGRDPKYKNSTETPLYKKSEILYGLNWAKDQIVRSQRAVLCEGYTDVIALQLAGVPEAVATCGTAATEDHVRMLRRFGATRLVLGYDADAAGANAAARFYAWEQRHQLDIRVIDLPAGKDPGDVGSSDPSLLQRAVEEARPFLSFRLDRVRAAADLSSNEGRARAAGQAMALVREHPAPMVQDQYVMEVAEWTRVSPDRLREALRGGSVPTSGGVGRERHRVPPVEADVLWFAVNEPDEAVSELMVEGLFADEIARSALVALLQSETLTEAISRADPHAVELLTRLANEERPEGDVVSAVADLLQRRTAEIRDANMRREDFAVASEENVFLAREVASLDDASTRADAVHRLVAFLKRRGAEEAHG